MCSLEMFLMFLTFFLFYHNCSRKCCGLFFFSVIITLISIIIAHGMISVCLLLSECIPPSGVSFTLYTNRWHLLLVCRCDFSETWGLSKICHFFFSQDFTGSIHFYFQLIMLFILYSWTLTSYNLNVLDKNSISEFQLSSSSWPAVR